MIPNYNRKVISGWTNYSGMVISHKINESEMGYRGSKSNFYSKFVKEQRVDGSWGLIKRYNTTISFNKPLRCTLMGFERNYRIKIPSNQLNKLSFSTLNLESKLNPWFITGFTDAEGSFSITVYPYNRSRLNWAI